MIKVAYKIVQTEPRSLPYISRVSTEDLDGQSWRDAKKELRAFFLKKAAELRGLSEDVAFPKNETVQ